MNMIIYVSMIIGFGAFLLFLVLESMRVKKQHTYDLPPDPISKRARKKRKKSIRTSSGKVKPSTRTKSSKKTKASTKAKKDRHPTKTRKSPDSKETSKKKVSNIKSYREKKKTYSKKKE